MTPVEITNIRNATVEELIKTYQHSDNPVIAELAKRLGDAENREDAVIAELIAENERLHRLTKLESQP